MAGEVYADELESLGHRAEDKGVRLPDEPSDAADMLGDVLSLEVRRGCSSMQLNAAEPAAAASMAFALTAQPALLLASSLSRGGSSVGN